MKGEVSWTKWVNSLGHFCTMVLVSSRPVSGIILQLLSKFKKCAKVLTTIERPYIVIPIKI